MKVRHLSNGGCSIRVEIGVRLDENRKLNYDVMLLLCSFMDMDMDMDTQGYIM